MNAVIGSTTGLVSETASTVAPRMLSRISIGARRRCLTLLSPISSLRCSITAPFASFGVSGLEPKSRRQECVDYARALNAM